MQQLAQETIDKIIKECLQNRPETPITKTHKNVPNGAYDTSKTNTRVFVYNEFAYFMASKMWIDSGNRESLPKWMQVDWGSYPDLP